MTDLAYHIEQAKAQNLDSNQVILSQSYEMGDGTILRASEKTGEGKIGVVINPAFATPRESYYTLASQLPYNVLIYDPRGVADSKGQYEHVKNISDIEEVGRQWKEKNGLERLIGVGHSIGGSALALTDVSSCPYDQKILLAPPADPTRTQLKIPEYMKQLPAILVLRMLHEYNKKRRNEDPRLRDDINNHYWHELYANFKNDPRLSAQKIENFKEFADALEQTPKLIQNTSFLGPETTLIYAGDDSMLGIDGRLVDMNYQVTQAAKKNRAEVILIEGLNHRFNKGPETKDIVQIDNSLLSMALIDLIDG